MERISWQRQGRATVRSICLIGLLCCFQQSVIADIVCSTGTETGFANNSGGFDDNSNPPASFNIQLTGLGTNAAADGFLDLEAFGDFSNAGEYIDISIEGISLGRLWDNDTTNDSFVGNNADNDRGQEYGQNFSNQPSNSNAVAQLTQSQLNTFLADGVLTISFDAFGAEVNNLDRDIDEFITAKVRINDANAVPEPSGALVATLLGIIGIARRKRVA